MRAVPLVVRLAWRNLRAQPGEALLLLVALCLATTVLSMALAVDETGDNAWERVWRTTRGADVVAFAGYDDQAAPAGTDLVWARQRLAALAAARGVAAAGGPWTGMAANGMVGGVSLALDITVRDAGPSAVDQPVPTSGRWLDGGDGVVLEDSLASVLQVSPGDTVTIAGVALPVIGSAIDIDAARYGHGGGHGSVWIGPSAQDRLHAAGVRDRELMLKLRLATREDAQAFAEANATGQRDGGQIEETVPGGRFFELDTRSYLRDQTHDDLDALALALLVVATMLAGLTVVTAATLVASRMAGRFRQVGTLKAVGVTPAQVAGVLVVEYAALAGVAAVAGLFAGTALSPSLAGTERELYGAPEAPPITVARAGIVLAVVISVVVLATVRPALRGTRRSTVRCLAADVRAPTRAPRLALLAGTLHLPLTARLGLAAALRRPGRTLIHTAGLTVGVAMVVMGLAVDDGWRRLRSGLLRVGSNPAAQDAQQALISQIRTLVIVGAGALVVIAAVNTLIMAVFTARDSARNHAIMRTLGATPAQTVLALVTAQLGAAVLACVLGIPLGVVLFDGFATGLAPARLSPLSYLAVVLGVLVTYGVVVAVPARITASRPVSPRLATE